ncbi:MAG: hypothetical protein KKF24_09560 [Gammaproteobacteria bacterium]|nr:hypothetical protein [Gammaproteobacteria bacterium]
MLINRITRPEEQLTQVVFILDYVQLFFGSDIFTFYNDPIITEGRNSKHRDTPGFCDKLVSFIGLFITEMSVAENGSLTLFLDNKFSIFVPTENLNTEGPEAWQFSEAKGQIWVQANV